MFALHLCTEKLEKMALSANKRNILIVLISCQIVGSSCMPLAKRLIDMTYVLRENMTRYPLMKDFKIDNLHNGTLDSLGGLWLQMEDFSMGTHVGTHMDAPSHFIKGGLNIDEIPISQFIAPAAVIDITAKAKLDPDAEATTEDLLQWESVTGQSLNGTIILLKSGWGKKFHDTAAYYGTADNDISHLHYPGMAPSACQWLVDNRNIKGIGIDTLSLDKGSFDSSYPLQSHVITLGHGIFILENVANIDKLPMYGAKLYVLPMKIGNASGAPTRIIASIPEVIYKLQTE